jgi:hypothetical protein
MLAGYLPILLYKVPLQVFCPNLKVKSSVFHNCFVELLLLQWREIWLSTTIDHKNQVVIGANKD